MREVRETYLRDYYYIDNGIKYDHLVVIEFYSDGGTLLNTISFDTDNEAGNINWERENNKEWYEMAKAEAERKERFLDEETSESEPTGEPEPSGETGQTGEPEPAGEEEPQQENVQEENKQQETKKSDSPKPSKNSEGNKNITDPSVVFDPIVKLNPIARKYYGVSYNYEKTEDDMYANVNMPHNSLKIDGIEYPLVVINTMEIEPANILYMGLKLEGFLPTITLTISDTKQYEQKIQTSNMNGSIEVCMANRIDKIYRNIRMHFRITNVEINATRNNEVTYYGEYDTEKFRQVNTGFLKKDKTKANFYELLYVIAQKCGLGFAVTNATADVNDRCLRNIFTQRYDDYIKEQLRFAGCDEDSILDAWVDPYNYIILTNVSYVLNKDIHPEELTTIAICGFPSTDRDVPDPKPKEVPRLLTNFNRMDYNTNLMIKSYSMIINNNAIQSGTLERVYTVNFNNSNVTLLDTLDIQTKQNSVDGEYLSEYNTGLNRPLPRFNFNEDGYDLNTQKIIREHFFRKRRQQILKLKLKEPNLGLQRGTLVSVSIFEQDPLLKEIMMSNVENIAGDTNPKKPDFTLKSETEITDDDLINNEGLQVVNAKLTDLYYIDSILFEYCTDIGEIEQTLFLIKKGDVSGYNNYHSVPKQKI